MELPAFQKRMKKEYRDYLHALWAMHYEFPSVLVLVLEFPRVVVQFCEIS